MTTRKKVLKPNKDEAKEKKAQPVVTQVVEVVGEVADSIPKEEVKEVVDQLKDEVADVEEKVSELEEKVEPKESSSETSEKEVHEPEKEVIEELFAKEESSIAPQLAGYKKDGSKALIVWVLIVVGVALATGTGLLLLVSGPTVFTSFVAKPTPPAKQDLAPQGTPTPTSAPEAVKREDFSIQVLNGSGKAGEAAKMKKFLEDKGYTVTDVGNADSSDFEKTAILTKKDKESLLEFLKRDLEGEYTIGTAEATLSEASSYDVRITVGKE